MKERPIIFSAPMVTAILEDRKTQTRRLTKNVPPGFSGELPDDWEWKSPYGDPGDRLWVRETWAPHDAKALAEKDRAFIYFRADDARAHPTDGKWRPCIFMPRWASRLNLEILTVRVERLRDITPEDARAEGCVDTAESSVRGNYASLWSQINGAGSWDANPWVWVIGFRRVP